jgi:chitodextrinase
MSAVGYARRYPSAYAPPRPTPEPPARPTARFTVDPPSPVVGDEVTFDASSSEGQIDRYSWQELASDQRAEGVTVSVTFATAGRKTMILTVYGPGGQHATGQYVDVAEEDA